MTEREWEVALPISVNGERVMWFRTGALLPSDKEQAVSEVAVLPRRSGSEDPNIRRGDEEERRGRVSLLRAPRLLGEGERVQRGLGGGAHRLQQVHGEVRGEGRVPPAGEGAPLPRAPYQQDAIVRRGGQAPDRDEGGVREAAGDVRESEYWTGAALRSM